MRLVLDTERPDTHGWSLGASDGDHNIRLDAMDEGLTRLVASLPTDEAESKGETWSAFLQLHASKARLLSLIASLRCLLMYLRAAARDRVHLLLMWYVLASAWHITADSAMHRECIPTLTCTIGVQWKGCWCAGKKAVTQGKNSLAAKLAASPVWLTLTLDAETFPSTAKQVLAKLPVC